ncbi:hypothetical protein B6U99_06215 [Candidatus Geothermarchaeota archaeon ex4572_27]|nr:MAG: hypothetical protein B6U99_06215 [Candidatus Geothermarchaeota archaeon ex4572_27]
MPRAAVYVPQSPYDQAVSGRVVDEVAFALENVGGRAEEAYEALRAVGLEGLAEAKVDELSGGQLHKLAIACALAVGSRVIVLDEPLAHLDPRSSRELVELLVELKRAGRTVILVEHRLRELVDALHEVDLALVLDSGRLVATVPGHRLHEEAALLSKLGLRLPANFKASLLLGSPLRAPSDRAPLMEAVRRLSMPCRRREPDGEVEVELSDVWVAYRGRDYVLRGVSTSLRKGGVYAVMGPNASGKTTLLMTMIGLLRPRRGRVEVAGRQVKGLSDLVGIASYVPQNPDLTLMFSTVEEELKERARRARGEVDVERLARDLMIDDLMDRNPHSLSRGQRFRVALAAALASSPRILFLDEPTTGQDEECIVALGEALKRFVDGGGLAVVTTHDVDFASNYADRCLILCGGKVVAEGPSLEVLSRVEVATFGLSRPMVAATCCEVGVEPVSERELFEVAEREAWARL